MLGMRGEMWLARGVRKGPKCGESDMSLRG